jgi:hypothetical protein
MLNSELYSAVSVVILPFVVMISLAARKKAAILQVAFAHISGKALNRARQLFSVARTRAKIEPPQTVWTDFYKRYVS